MSYLPLLAFQPLLVNSLGMHGVTYLLVFILSLPIYISMWYVFMSFIGLARDDFPLRMGLIGRTFFAHMLCVEKWIMAYWKMILSVLHLIR